MVVVMDLRGWKRATVCAAFALVMMGTFARASVVAVSGAAAYYAEIPADIRNDRWASETEARVWFERGAQLAAAATLDHVASTAVIDDLQLVPGEVEAGAWVESYMIRSDTTAAADHFFVGSVTFDTAILGIIVHDASLDASDVLARPGVQYNSNSGRGVDFGNDPDVSVSISQDRRTVTFSLITGRYTDDIRVITQAPPAPQCPACSADFNDDGGVDGGDLGAFFASYEAGDACADVNQDGGVDIGDVAGFLDQYQAGGC